MKIFNFGLNIQPGKYKYQCSHFTKLVEKFAPLKQSPYIVEFVSEDLDKAGAVAYHKDKKLDFVLIDLEKIEKRLLKTEDEKEKTLLNKAVEVLEKEELLCDSDFSLEEKQSFRLGQLVTVKPSIAKTEVENIDSLIKEILDKAGIIMFFTAGKKEVHAWNLAKGECAVEAAGKIHSDLKRGFIKADIANCRDLDSFFNMAEAKSRGFIKVVGKDYIIEENDIIEIRFSV
ncbi:MAG: DUF933 domain-containing protein [Candidatus Omnitrophota bacterium]